MKFTEKFSLKEVKVEDLKEWEINPRIHNDKGLLDVKESIAKLGTMAFLMADNDLTIIGGHGRKKVLIELGEKTTQVWVANEKLDEKSFKKAALLSNRIFARFDNNKLNEAFDAMDLIDFGFDTNEVDFGEDQELDDNELENTAAKEVAHKLKFSFDTLEDKQEFEDFLLELKKVYPEIETIGDRFIKFLQDKL